MKKLTNYTSLLLKSYWLKRISEAAGVVMQRFPKLAKSNMKELLKTAACLIRNVAKNGVHQQLSETHLCDF
jgi:hypothetical protein